MPKPFKDLDTVVTSEAKASDRTSASRGAQLESVPGRRRRRVFTAADKLRILREADAALASGERGALEALLRKRGIYSSQLSSWRAQLQAQGAAGLAVRKPGRKPQLTEPERQLAAATKRSEMLERKLHIANALIALQKKAYALLDLTLPESDEEA